MPIRLIQSASFDPDVTQLMGLAYENACARAGSDDLATREAIARRIIEAARKGERDIDKLADYALQGPGSLSAAG